MEAALDAFDIRSLTDEGGDPHKLEGLFTEWTIFDKKSRIFAGKTGLEYFIEHNPLKLPESEMAAYRDLLYFRANFFDIAAVRPGEGVVLKDGGVAYDVADVNASMSLKKGDTVWCRIASVRGVYQMTSSTMFSAPITFSKNMKAVMTNRGRDIVDAREAAKWAYQRGVTEEKKPQLIGDQRVVPVEEAAHLFDNALKASGMQDMLSSDTVKIWTSNERTFALGFPMKAIFFLLPEELSEQKRDVVLSTLNVYLNNLPRRQLKGKTPLEASAAQGPNDKHFDLDLFHYSDYTDDIRAAHALMKKNENTQSYKAFEALIRRLLDDKVPIITAFRIYANASACLLMKSEGADPLGRELTRACLRLNPSYDFGIRQKQRLLDPYEDFSGLSKKDARFSKLLLCTADADGVRRYRRSVFRRYEDFLTKCSISLKYATKTTPTIFRTKDGVVVKPGRNDPCICGSDKKFKKCCGVWS